MLLFVVLPSPSGQCGFYTRYRLRWYTTRLSLQIPHLRLRTLQHGFELTPTGIEHRFGHFGFNEFLTGHIAYENGRILINKLATVLVQGILSTIFNIGMNRFDLLLLFSSRCYTQLFFQLSVFTAFHPITVDGRSGQNKGNVT